ncbi:MAG: nucleic acid binding [Marteilia pararefringens]
MFLPFAKLMPHFDRYIIGHCGKNQVGKSLNYGLRKFWTSPRSTKSIVNKFNSEYEMSMRLKVNKRIPKILMFMDFETTSLKDPQPTELSLIAININDLFNCKNEQIPRILNKLSVCFNPEKQVDPDAEKITGLSRKLLRESPKVDKRALAMIRDYINSMQSELKYSNASLKKK